MHFGKKHIAWIYILAAGVYLIYCLLYTPNLWLSIPIVIYPLIAFRLFWLDNQPNILFWGMMLQWVPASTQLLYCNFYQITLTEKVKSYSSYVSNMELATLLSITGVFAFSIGLYVAIRNLKLLKFKSEVDTYPERKLLVLYFVVSVLIYLTSGLIWIFPGLVQYMFALFYVKWGFFLVMFFIVHKRAPFLKWYLYAFLGFELLLGLSSFFAGQIILTVLYSVVAIIHLRPKLNIRYALLLAVVVMVLFHYLILWSAIKTEYRKFVSQGKVTQSVLVTPEEARDKLFSLMNNVDATKYQVGIESLVNRLGYIQFFSISLEYVPRVVPHQYGQVYWSAIQHYLVPRFLNPDKEILDDSKHTSKFTGMHLSGLKEGSSFSLGYIADAYIDFGPVLMHALLFLVGWFFGFTYQYLVKRCPNEVWIWILTGPYILLLNINGADTHKAIGGLLLYFLSILIVRKTLIRLVESYLRGGTSS